MFCGWECHPSKINVYINGNELIKHEHIKAENHGRTVFERHIPHEFLRMHGFGSNKITVKFVEGPSSIFLDWFKISAEIAAAHIGAPSV